MNVNFDRIKQEKELDTLDVLETDEELEHSKELLNFLLKKEREKIDMQQEDLFADDFDNPLPDFSDH